MGHKVKTEPDPYYKGVSNYVVNCYRCGVLQLYMEKLSVSERVDGELKPIFVGHCRNCGFKDQHLAAEEPALVSVFQIDTNRAENLIMYLGGKSVEWVQEEIF